MTITIATKVAITMTTASLIVPPPLLLLVSVTLHVMTRNYNKTPVSQNGKADNSPGLTME